MKTKLFFVLFLSLFLSGQARALTLGNANLPYNPTEIKIGNFTDNNTSIINVPLGSLDPGSVVNYSWKIPTTNGLKYSLRYGCALSASLRNDNTVMSPVLSGNWIVPRNPGENCYCKLWITVTDATGKIVGGANSRPVYVCKKLNAYGFRGQVKGVEGKDYKEGEILVKFKASNVPNIAGFTLKKKIGSNIGVYSFTGLTVQQAFEKIAQQMPFVLDVVEPNYYAILNLVPNDPDFLFQWYLTKIQADQAWDITTGGDAIVAVLDFGIDYNQPEFKNNLWDGSKGCLDPNGAQTKCPFYGWDAADNDNDPYTEPSMADAYTNYSPQGAKIIVSHGSIMASLIGAVGNNNTDMTGMNWKAKIMAVKVLGRNSISANQKERILMSDLVSGARFAMNNGAKIINLSLSSIGGMDILYDEFVAGEKKGVLFVTGAGNIATDASIVQPCSFNTANNLCVGGTDQNDQLWDDGDGYGSGFNVQKQVVHIGAPASDILSLAPLVESKPYAGKGVSEATALTSGLAGLIANTNPKLSAIEIKNIILETGDDVGLQSKFTTGKRINAYKAVKKAKESAPPPQPVYDVTVLTETANYDAIKKSAEFKASVGNVIPSRVLEYAFYWYIRDDKSNIVSAINKTVSSTAMFEKAYKVFTATQNNLPAISFTQTFCVKPLVADKVANKTYRGQEICFPNVPWVRTNPPAKRDNTIILSGEITQYAGKEKLERYFEVDMPNNVIATLEKLPINYPTEKIFSANGSFLTDSGNQRIEGNPGDLEIKFYNFTELCYKACAVVTAGNKIPSCGQKLCKKIADISDSSGLETISMQSFNSGTRFVGKVKGAIGSTALMKFYPKDPTLLQYVGRIEGAIITADGEFIIDAKNLQFLGEPYCAKAGIRLKTGEVQYAINEKCIK